MENYKTDQYDRLITCLHCGEKNDYLDDENADFCIHCGYALRNQCTNYGECGVNVQPSAAYCPYCGSETYFYKSGLVKSKRKENAVDFKDDDLPF